MKNKSYKLNNVQIKNLNILHDCREADKEKRKEIIDGLIKEIELWQN